MSSVPMVFARSVRKIADAVAARGDARLLLRTAGLDHDAINDPGRRIPYADMMLLSEHAAMMTKDGAFGLHAGERETLDTYGIVGYSIITSSTVEQALRCQVRYLPIWTNVGMFRLEVQGPVALFRWEYSPASLPESRHDCETSLATVKQYLRLLTGGQWKPREVWFRHRKPRDVSEHGRIFKAPVCFGMPTDALLFESNLLSAPIRSANPHAHRMLTDAIERRPADALEAQTFSQLALSLIRQGMSRGQVGVETVSRQLCVSRRTLQRKLKQESCSHRELVQQARQELSRFLLSSTSATTVEAAYALGFSEPSAFYHAFQQWFGVSPQAYRRAAGSH